MPSPTSVHCHFHADNCVGQNKNKSVLAYLMWRTLVGLNEEIVLSFMRVGHTRCIVDGCFGLLKKRYRASDCDTMQHLKIAVELSAKCNSVQCFDWEWREWDTFFASSFKPFPGIRKFIIYIESGVATPLEYLGLEYQRG